MTHEETVYDALDHAHGGDSGQWAFGTGFDDPLAGVDTTRCRPGVDRCRPRGVLPDAR